MTTSSTRGFRRRGVLTFELILVLPIVLIALCGVVEVVQLLSAQTRLQHAVSLAGRQATLPGSSLESVRAAARTALGRGSVQRAVQIQVTTLGNQVLPGEIELLPSGTPLQVTLIVPAKAAAQDFLRYLGFPLASRQLTEQIVVRRE